MIALIVTICITVADQLTKVLVLQHFHIGETVSLLPVFNLTYVRNTGAAWGMLKDFNTALIALSIVVLGSLVIFRRAFIQGSKLNELALGLMMGGILGNMIDRLRLGYVIDFLDFHWGTNHFPSFNVADSAICVGVAIYLVTSLIQSAREASNEKHASDTPDGTAA